jgi:hypothetical protein
LGKGIHAFECEGGLALGAGLVTALQPLSAASAQPVHAAPAASSATAEGPITTCEAGYHGWIRRAGKDAICLKPGTHTWDVKVFECAGDLTLFFKNGKQVYCGGSMTAPIDLAVDSNVLKTEVGWR